MFVCWSFHFPVLQACVKCFCLVCSNLYEEEGGNGQLPVPFWKIVGAEVCMSGRLMSVVPTEEKVRFGGVPSKLCFA